MSATCGRSYGRSVADPVDTRRPALTLVAPPGHRVKAVALGAEADQRGFPGLALPSNEGTIALSATLCSATNAIAVWPSVHPIHLSHPVELAHSAAYLHETSGGRFRLGLGISHDSLNAAIGATTGPPLDTVRRYVSDLRALEDRTGPLPPIYLAAMGPRMFDVALDIADGAIMAHGCFSQVTARVALTTQRRPSDFLVANMVWVAIDEDLDAARSVVREAMSTLIVQFPNYRNYWRGAGYADEMDALESALASGDDAAARSALSDQWVDDCAVVGPPAQVRDRLDQWTDLGVLPVASMVSATGSMFRAIRALFELYP